ncbi:MAG: PhzF family phenazine biosynthesis protein [Firmicutes bacterium]|nr:PhzF family phenazine biosynthesis protein [Bacillota bacterium]
MKLFIADAFTQNVFGGNPAGVVITGGDTVFPPEEIMLKTAAELRYSETAFIRQTGEREFTIRYFTPAAEVDLCGHATIASFQCLLDAGIVKDGEEYTAVTSAGNLKISISSGFIMMEMAAAEFRNRIDSDEALRELYGIMGIPYEAVNNEGRRLYPEIISTGLPDIIMPVSSRRQLAELTPDFNALSALSEKYGVTGVHAFTLDNAEPEITAHCRNFAPLYDIDEEAATGTASGALTYYLYTNGITGKGRMTFLQGEAMGRPSQILTDIDNADNSVNIRVGGSAAILVRGEIFL